MAVRESGAPQAFRAATEAVAAQPEQVSLLDLMIQTENVSPRDRWERLRQAPASPDLAIAYFHQRCGRVPRNIDELVGLLQRDVAELDVLLNRQVNAILHHPRFQRLEAGWRGLQHLLQATQGGENVRVTVMTLSKHELANDLRAAVEFDQSEFFKKVYEQEYGTAGGEPFGVIVADYEFGKTPADIDLLGRIAGVSAAAFAPFIAAAQPEAFGINSYSMLDRVGSLSAQFDGLRDVSWNALRNKEDARFLGLTLPRILLRLPYEELLVRDEAFLFQEDVSALDRSGYLWGNAAFAFGAVLIQAFINNAWFANIRGTSEGPGSGGVVPGFPVHSFQTDPSGTAIKCSTETIVDERREKELNDLGFLALCDCEDTDFCAFFATQSLQKPKAYDDELATVNAQMSAMLQYIFCASRFAHYLKVIAREMIGSYSQASRLQSQLHSWLHQYVAQDPGATARIRARFPLRDARVVVHEHPREPGHFLATLDVWPHFQLDEMTASVKLVTNLGSP